MGEEPFFLPGKTLPTNISVLVPRSDESIVVVHEAVAFLATNCRFMTDLWIDGFNQTHNFPTPFLK